MKNQITKILFILLLISLFLASCTNLTQKDSSSKCRLWVNDVSNSKVCSKEKPDNNWHEYVTPVDEMGTPYMDVSYACYKNKFGQCELAQ